MLNISQGFPTLSRAPALWQCTVQLQWCAGSSVLKTTHPTGLGSQAVVEGGQRGEGGEYVMGAVTTHASPAESQH